MVAALVCRIPGIHSRAGSLRRGARGRRMKMSTTFVLRLTSSELVTRTAFCSTGEIETAANVRQVRIACLLVALACRCGAIANPTDIKACLAGLCVAGHRVTEKAVVAKLGNGTRVNRPDDIGLSRCYFDAGSGVWADFTFAGAEESSGKGKLRGIMLTEQKICEGQKGDRKRSLGRQLAGASIGMAESEVLASRGQPTRVDDAKEREVRKPAMADTRYSAKFGDRVYVYEKPDDPGSTFIYFKDGRVRTIWFSES